MSKTYLFVYGTLRKDFPLSLEEAVAKELVFTGTGKVNAMLYDLGDYPGAVKKGQTEILGDVFEVKGEDVFAVLDAYEGAEYRRERENVKLSTGEMVEAWLYWYTGETTESTLIKNEDYLHYLKTKKTVSYKWNTTQ